MKKRDGISSWFQEELSDEAVYVIHDFLEAFMVAFENRYCGQIHRHLESVRREEQLEIKFESTAPVVDNVITF